MGLGGGNILRFASLPRRLIKWCLNIGVTLRLVIYILVVAAVPVILIAAFAFKAGANGIARHTNLHLASVATITAQSASHWLSPIGQSAGAFAAILESSGRLDTLLSGPQDTPDSVLAQLKSGASDIIASNSLIRRIDVLSPDSQQTLFSYMGRETQQDFIHTLADRPPSTGYRITLPPAVQGQEPQLAVVETALKRGDRILARLAIHVSTTPLMQALSGNAGLGDNGRMYLVDSEGLVLSSSVHFTSRQEPLRAPSEVIPMSPQATDGLRYTDLTGQEVVAAYAPVESSPWFIITEVPASEAFSDIERMRNTIIAALVPFFILLVFVAALISRRVTQPVRVLSAGAIQIGQGNLSHRIEVSGNDEIAKLAAAFNHMASDLDKTQTRMVAAERSSTLRKFTENTVLQLKKLSHMGLIIASTCDIEKLMEICPSVLRQLTSADAAAIVLFDDEERICNFDHESGENSYPIAMFTTDDRLKWLFPDDLLAKFQKHGPGDYPPSGQNTEKFAHIIDVRLYDDTNENTGAVIIASQSQDRPFSDQDAELFQIIAGYISASTQRLRKAEHLQQSELRAVQALSDLENAQDQLLQSQKLEYVGRLAGGIAHDFNNLLTPIMGYAQLSAKNIPPEHENIRDDLEEIEKMAVKGAKLTKQLLAFSRRQIIEPTIVNLNTLVLDMDRMLRRVIGEHIKMVTHTSSQAGNVRVDPSQIDQVVMNLVVNARDAMPKGGRIDLKIKNVTLGDDFARRNPDAQPGEYVVLSVTDTGTGIPEHVIPNVFEPFYTTKADGAGTGLGLATCYGIVKQNGGHIELKSQVDQGTSITIYLPRITREQPIKDTPQSPPSEIPRGNETVLLVEDEPAVRNLAARVLTEQGYTVLEAANGAEALQIAEAISMAEIDLLLTDVIMPIMGGKEVADRLTAMRPDLKVLFTSGYTDDTIARQGILKPGTAFTHKPFTPSDLANKVREVLDSPMPVDKT